MIIEGKQYDKHIITSSCTVPGLPKDQEAYRRKLAGILRVVSIIEIICKKHNITEG